MQEGGGGGTHTTYTSAHRAYYLRNKEEILTKYKDAKPYKAFYERNKERLKEQALARYYKKKEAAAAAAAVAAAEQS